MLELLQDCCRDESLAGVRACQSLLLHTGYAERLPSMLYLETQPEELDKKTSTAYQCCLKRGDSYQRLKLFTGHYGMQTIHL